MATRNIKEYLESGEANNIILGGNIKFNVVEDPAYDNMFMRVDGGVVSLYRAPDQDVHWTDADTANIAMTTSPVELLSIAPDQELVSADSGYKILGRLDNTVNQIRTVIITILYDAVPQGTVNIELDKEQTNVPISYMGLVQTPVPAGTVISVTFEASGIGVDLRGDAVATSIKVTKAQSAPVVMSVNQLESFDWNQLPHGNPHVAGQLYIHGNNTVRVSQG